MAMALNGVIIFVFIILIYVLVHFYPIFLLNRETNEYKSERIKGGKS